MRKLQCQPQQYRWKVHSVRDVRRSSRADADKMEAEIMTLRALRTDPIYNRWND